MNGKGKQLVKKEKDCKKKRREQEISELFRMYCALIYLNKVKPTKEEPTKEECDELIRIAKEMKLKIIKKGVDKAAYLADEKYKEEFYKDLLLVDNFGNDKKKPDQHVDPNHKKVYDTLARILFTIYGKLNIDGQITKKEQDIFDFICIKFNIIDFKTRNALFEILKKKYAGIDTKIINIEDEIVDKEKIRKSPYKDFEILKKNLEYNTKLSYDDIDNVINIIKEAQEQDTGTKIYNAISGFVKDKLLVSKKDNKFSEEEVSSWSQNIFFEIDRFYIAEFSEILKNMKKIDISEITEIIGEQDIQMLMSVSDIDNDENSKLPFNYKTERYLDIYGDTLFVKKETVKDTVEYIYNFFRVTMADGEVSDKEYLLSRVFSMLYNIQYSIYLRLRKAYIDSLKGKNANKCKKDLKDILYNKTNITEDYVARFSLIVAIAMVDGKIGEKEEIKLYNIGLTDYGLPIAQITEIISRSQKWSEYRGRGIGRSSENEILANIPSAPKEKYRDLWNCLDVIYVDNQVSEAEKKAFEIICLIYGVDNRYFEKSENRNIPPKFRKKLRDIDEKGRVRLDIMSFSKIEEIFSHNIIKGPLLGGIKYALERRLGEVKRSQVDFRQLMTKLAFLIFAISSFLLVITANVTTHHSYEEYTKKPETAWDITAYVASSKVAKPDTTARNTQNKEGTAWDITAYVASSKAANLDTTARNIQKKEETARDTTDIWNKVKFWWGNICNKTDQHSLKNLDALGGYKIRVYAQNFVYVSILFALFCVGGLYLLRHITYYRIKRLDGLLRLLRKRKIPFLLLITYAFMILFSGYLLSAVLILSTMLSVEWLILMKSEHKTGGHSSMLAILVIMAIVADLSFGMIELKQVYDAKPIADKIFSALFLGCICFFSGKFIELVYNHQKFVSERMEEALKRIEKF